MANMRRDKDEVIAELLNICTKGVSKTHIVYQANLNFRTIDPYLKILIKDNLIETYGNQHIRYRTTEKGINLMKGINQLENNLSEPV